MSWLYGGDVDAMRHDVGGCRFSDEDVRATIKKVYEERGYLLDPHSAIAYMGLVGRVGQLGQVGRVGQIGRLGQAGRLGEAAGLGRVHRSADEGRVGIFLATAHPAKFAETVEPIIGRAVEKPPALAQALARPRHIIRIDPSLAAVVGMLDG
jgi:threonine synthase